jgi:hypothetical protein
MIPMIAGFRLTRRCGQAEEVGMAVFDRQSIIGNRQSAITAHDCGVTLVETMAAVAVALIGVFGLGSVIFQATVINKNRGTELTRATIYAQDKLEKMLSLDFASCTQSASTQPSTCNTTNITDTNWTQGLLAGGPISSSQTTGPPTALTCPDASGSSIGYMDFLDANGNQLPQSGSPPVSTPGSCSAVTGTSISYVREWTITDLTPPSGGPAVKQITVAVYSENGVNSEGGKPIVMVTSVLSNPN